MNVRLLWLALVALPTSLRAQAKEPPEFTLGHECLRETLPRLRSTVHPEHTIVGVRCHADMLLGLQLRSGDVLSWQSIGAFAGNRIDGVKLDSVQHYWSGSALMRRDELLAFATEQARIQPKNPTFPRILEYVRTEIEGEQARIRNARAELDEERAKVAAEKAREKQEASDRKRAANARAAAQSARISRIKAAPWPNAFKDLVYARKIAIGMTAEMVKEAWGRPETINETISASGTREQWVYESSYVYFERGVVTTIQTSR